MLLVLFLALPVAAQDWSVYLYNAETKDLVRIFADGTEQSYNLGLREDLYITGWDMAFSDDGSQVAYCQMDNTQARPEGIPTSLIVREIATETDMLTLDLGVSTGCQVSDFSDDGGTVAVGTVNYFPGDPNADTSRPAWQLRLIEVASGAVTAELNADSPAAVALFPNFSPMPRAAAIQPDSVIFTPIPWGTGGAIALDAYIWYPASGDLEPAPAWGNLSFNRLAASGEMIWLANEPDLPAVDAGGPIAALNVVVYQTADGSQQIVYHSADATLLAAMFVNNGRQIAIMMLAGTGEVQSTRIVLLDRSGSEAEIESLAVTQAYTEMMPAPDGLVLFRQVAGPNFEPPIVFSVEYLQDGRGRGLWVRSYDEAQFGWQMVWTAPTATAENLSPFPAAP